MKFKQHKLLRNDEERLKARLSYTPTERFRLIINLFKLNTQFNQKRINLK